MNALLSAEGKSEHLLQRKARNAMSDSRRLLFGRNRHSFAIFHFVMRSLFVTEPPLCPCLENNLN